MIQKFQQGGQQDAIMQFVQGLAQVLQADPQQVVQAAQQNPKALEAAVQTYQQTQDMNQAAQVFTQTMQQQVQAARHGAKLQYIRSLKNQCPEGEELYYYKKGGSIGCGCKKKEDGGEIQEAKCGAVTKFKKARKADSGTKIMQLAEANKQRKAKEAAAKKEQQKKAETWGGSWIHYADKNATYGNKKEPKEQDNAIRDRKENPENSHINKVPRKACGSKIKKDCNGSVIKFKMHRQGGSLNGIPFYQGGTNISL